MNNPYIRRSAEREPDQSILTSVGGVFLNLGFVFKINIIVHDGTRFQSSECETSINALSLIAVFCFVT